MVNKDKEYSPFEDLFLLGLSVLIVSVSAILIHLHKDFYGYSRFLDTIQNLLMFVLVIDMIRYLFRRSMHFFREAKRDIDQIKSKLKSDKCQ